MSDFSSRVSMPNSPHVNAIGPFVFSVVISIMMSAFGADQVGETAPLAASDADLALVRSRLLEPYREPVSESQVRSLVKSQRADGSWPDVNYESKERSGWKTTRHLSHVLILARTYMLPVSKSPDSKPQDNAALKKAVNLGLDYWLAKDFKNSNWWHNQIGVPGAMAPILLLLDEELSDSQRAKGIEILKRADLTMTGQNLVWLAQIVASRGILERNANLVSAAYARIGAEIRTSLDEGIQPDFSFHQHGPCLYSHGYGAGFASDCSETAVRLAGTRFAFSPEKISLLTHLILDGHQWLARGSTPDYGAIGRQTSRPSQSVRYLSRVARNMMKLDTGRQAEFEALAARSEGQAAPALSGNRHFWCSDTMVHHREAYFTSARMYSRRIVNTDGVSNGEGLLNHHIADGCNLLQRTGDEYTDIFAVWNWEMIPGTTVELKGKLEGSPRRKGETDFVGGVSDGEYGAASFDLRQGPLHARKSWFFFDDQYVCLGAGITCDSDKPIITTLNQCLLRGDVSVCEKGQTRKLERGETALQGPAWVYHDQVGYFFPAAAQVRVRSGSQTGSWHLIASEDPDRPVEKDVFSLWIEHGSRTDNGKYAYIVGPGMPLTLAAAESRQGAVEVLANESRLQAVRHAGLDIAESVFFEPAELRINDQLAVQVDQPCLLLLRKLPGRFAVTLSNPKNEALCVDVRVTADGQTLQSKVELPGGMEAGRSVTTEVRQGSDASNR